MALRTQTQPRLYSTRRASGGATLGALELRMSELEELATSQSHELRIQFERIAQLQAECDILRIRFTKSGVMPSRNIKGGQADGAKIQDLA